MFRVCVNNFSNGRAHFATLLSLSYSRVFQLSSRLFSEAPIADFVERDGVLALEFQQRLIDQHFDGAVGNDAAGGPTRFAEIVAFGGDFWVDLEPIYDDLRGFLAVG